MYVLLFFIIYFNLFLLLNLKFTTRNSYVISWVSMLLFSYVFTEFLNQFLSINIYNLILIYSIFAILSTILVFINRISIKIKITETLKNIPKPTFPYIYLILFFILILAFICMYVSPNNWDSMTYHLGRVAHWQQNQNIQHYPSHISRQLFNPPLVEYMQLHIFILTNDDYFLNLIQLFSFIGCIIMVSLIVKELGYNFISQVTSSIVCLTIPMALLQSTSTKNELTVALLFITSVYLFVKLLKNIEWKIVAGLGIITGMALATKATSYVYLPAVFVVFFIALAFKSLKKTIFSGLVISIISITIVCPIYLRNYKSYGHPLGATANERSWYSNSTYNWQTLVSNFARNSYIHLANVKLFNSQIFGKQSDYFKYKLYKLHEKLNIDILNQNTTWGATNMDFTLERDEDYAGNYLHFISSIFSVLFLTLFFKFFKPSKIELLLILIALGVLFFFCFYLKWQPWHSRLHTPIFILTSVIITIFLSKINFYIRNIILSLFILGSITYLVENSTRPILFKKPKIFNLTRDETMFRKKGNEKLNDTYQMADFINNNKVDTLGFVLDEDAWDYALFKILKRNNKSLIIDHINVSEEDTPKSILENYPISKCKYILSNVSLDQNFINFNGKVFYSVFKNNNYAVYK